MIWSESEFVPVTGYTGYVLCVKYGIVLFRRKTLVRSSSTKIPYIHTCICESTELMRSLTCKLLNMLFQSEMNVALWCRTVTLMNRAKKQQQVETLIKCDVHACYQVVLDYSYIILPTSSLFTAQTYYLLTCASGEDLGSDAS
jgi:hypothetical protein